MTMLKNIAIYLTTFLIIAFVMIFLARYEQSLLIFSFIAPIAVFIMPRIMCTLEVYKMAMDGKSGADKIKCFIPFYNTYFIRKLQYNEAPVVGGLLLFSVIQILVVTTLARFVVGVDTSAGLVINLIVSWLNICVIIMLWVIEGVVNVKLANQIGYYNKLICFLLPPLGSYFLSSRIRKFYNKNKNELRGVFEGGN